MKVYVFFSESFLIPKSFQSFSSNNSISTLGLNNLDSLPHDVVVHSYNLVIEPHFKYGGVKPTPAQSGTFDGSVSISFSVLKPTTTVELASGVTISKTYITSSAGRHTIKKQSNGPNKHLIIETGETLKTDEKITLSFKYSGKMTDLYFPGLFQYCEKHKK